MQFNRFTIFAATFFLALSPFPVSAEQYAYDAAVRQGSITFSQSNLFANEGVRIYGNLVNLGIQDIAGMVTFYQGAKPLGDPQPFSLRAQSASEDFWVDWTPTEGTYNVMMSISLTSPRDQNVSNNTAVTSQMTIVKRPPPPPPPPPPVPAPILQPVQQVSPPIVATQSPSVKPAPKPQSKITVETADEIQTSSSRKAGSVTQKSLPIKKGTIANQLITSNGTFDTVKTDALVDSAIEMLSSTEKLPTYPTPIRNADDTAPLASERPSPVGSNQGMVLVVILSALAVVSLAGGLVFWGLSKRE